MPRSIPFLVVEGITTDDLLDLTSHLGLLRTCDNYEARGTVWWAIEIAFERCISEIIARGITPDSTRAAGIHTL